MKIFAIKNDYDTKDIDYGFLIYYPKSKNFYIELPDKANIWSTPPILASRLKRGEYTINSYWSKLWVQQRIVPPDRQNIAQILKNNHLKYYDEFDLLMLTNGRCEQDDYYLELMDNEIFEKIFEARFKKKVEDVVPLSNYRVLVFFVSGDVKLCDINKLVNNQTSFKPILNNVDIFNTVTIDTGGYGIAWGSKHSISCYDLYDSGEDVPITLDDFLSFTKHRIISTSQACDILHCSRQNIKDLVTRGRLHPIKEENKNTYFLKSEVVKRLWE